MVNELIKNYRKTLMTLCLVPKMTFEIPGNDNNYNLNCW